MKIGIDISQLAFPNTGVANFIKKLVEQLVTLDTKNEYILFASSFRQRKEFITFVKFLKLESKRNVQVKVFPFPPTLLDLLWNKLHVLPIETFIGPIDVFISSDWTQPPTRVKKATILYDLIVYKYPKETAQKIIDVQKRKLHWVKKEVDTIFCISEATKKDAEEILGIPQDRLHVIYPGI